VITVILAIVSAALLFSLIWITLMATSTARNPRNWHYCAGCGAYVDPKGNPHDRMPYESDFNEVSDVFITCDKHN
jgi:hypothetical protein